MQITKEIFNAIEAACKPSPCGENTQCEVINQVPVCTCLPGYRGSPLAGCRHECENDSECPQHLACSSSFRCESPCKCGENAECQVVNHQAKCTCPKVRHIPLFILERKKKEMLQGWLNDTMMKQNAACDQCLIFCSRHGWEMHTSHVDRNVPSIPSARQPNPPACIKNASIRATAFAE